MKGNNFLKLVFAVAFCLIFYLGSAFGKGNSSSPPPKTYSINDLIDGLGRETFITDAWYKPADALVQLDYSPVCSVYSRARKISIARTLIASPKYKNKARIFSTNVDWTRTSTMAFDWDGYWNRSDGRKGDLIFTRGTGTGAEVIKRVSHWTHVAFTYAKGQVFESTPNTGVSVNWTSDTWGASLTHYTCKRMKWVSAYDAARVVDWGKSVYQGKPYIPNLLIASYSLTYFLWKWGYKYDMDSMYCSKLVYLVYKNNPYVKKDLDTGITGCISNDTLVESERPWTASVFNWVGVSPDDIYYSDELGPDFAYRI